MAISDKGHTLLWMGIAVGLGVFFTVPLSARRVFAGSKTEENWKERLEPALRKMELFFSEVQASGQRKTTTKLKGLNIIQAKESLQKSGGAFKYATIPIEPKSKVAENVYCRNPDRYVFELERFEPQSGFVVKRILPKTNPHNEVKDIFPFRFILVSHHVQGIPLSLIMNDLSFLVKSFSVDGNTAYLKFDWSPSAETMPNLAFSSAELWLSVEKGWAIEKYRVPMGPRGSKPTPIEGAVEYDRMENGVAIPKRIFERHGQGGTVEFVLEKFEHAVTDQQDFTLSYYGLPEPMGMVPVERAGIRWYIWLALAAFASVVIALLFRVLKRRFQAAEPVKN